MKHIGFRLYVVHTYYIYQEFNNKTFDFFNRLTKIVNITA